MNKQIPLSLCSFLGTSCWFAQVSDESGMGMMGENAFAGRRITVTYISTANNNTKIIYFVVAVGWSVQSPLERDFESSSKGLFLYEQGSKCLVVLPSSLPVPDR